jgi:hypothetical protein
MTTRKRNGRIELGTLDLLVLRTLVLYPVHGHAIAKAIERNSEDVLLVEQGSLHPAQATGCRDHKMGEAGNAIARILQPTA